MRCRTSLSAVIERHCACWCETWSTMPRAIRHRTDRSKCVPAQRRGEAVLEVTDTGPGIAPADRERVFDRFYRRAAAQETGTGLGLAIVKAIAERHGARVVLGEAPGGGLRATVSFPKAAS